jgi:transcription-repair coupling factor (superfamily II helicase)
MEPKELEEVMLKFMRREADILVSTTIIESGIDIPTANTMIIDDADRFGLAELHQLRGRVGRSKHRAYCYLLLPADRAVKEVAQKRLKAIEQYSMLGAGFKIAMRDLEIRGAGNILGAEQSGHIAAVGYEMYCRLLDNAVHQLTNSTDEAPVAHTKVDIGLYGLLPKPYIPADQRRLEAYRRLASAATPPNSTPSRRTSSAPTATSRPPPNASPSSPASAPPPSSGGSAPSPPAARTPSS